MKAFFPWAIFLSLVFGAHALIKEDNPATAKSSLLGDSPMSGSSHRQTENIIPSADLTRGSAITGASSFDQEEEEWQNAEQKKEVAAETITRRQSASLGCVEYEVTMSDSSCSRWGYGEAKLYIGTHTITMSQQNSGDSCSQSTTVCLEPGTYTPYSCGGSSWDSQYQSWTVGGVSGQGSTSCSDPTTYGSIEFTWEPSPQPTTSTPQPSVTFDPSPVPTPSPTIDLAATQLQLAIKTGAIIELDKDVVLNKGPIIIDGETNLLIDGKGHQVDGLWDGFVPYWSDQIASGTQCFNITHAEVTLQNMRIANCYTRSEYGTGAISSMSSKLTLNSISLSNSAHNGLYVSETYSGGSLSSTIIKQCEFTKIHGSALRVELQRRRSYSTPSLEIDEATFKKNGQAISLQGRGKAVVTKCNIVKNGYGAISVQGQGYDDPFMLNLTSGTVAGNNGTGIYLSSYVKAVIAGSKFEENFHYNNNPSDIFFHDGEKTRVALHVQSPCSANEFFVTDQTQELNCASCLPESYPADLMTGTCSPCPAGTYSCPSSLGACVPLSDGAELTCPSLLTHEDVDYNNGGGCSGDCNIPFGDPCKISDFACFSDCDAGSLEATCSWVEDKCAEDAPLAKFCTHAPSGFCFEATSTVSVLKSKALRTTEKKAVKDLKVGDKIVAIAGSGINFDAKGTAARFATVTSLPHSPSQEDFVEITVSKASKHDGPIRATLHHTFPSCSGKPVQAKDLKPGHCLYTMRGFNTVQSAKAVAPRKGDVTYTIEVEHGFGLIAVGGVFTHSKSATMHHAALTAKKKSLKKTVTTTAPQRLASFEKVLQPTLKKKVPAGNGNAAAAGNAELKGEVALLKEGLKAVKKNGATRELALKEHLESIKNEAAAREESLKESFKVQLADDVARLRRELQSLKDDL